MTKTTKQPMVVIGAKVPVELREAIEKRASAEKRSVSQVISLLLESHPALKGKSKSSLAAL